MKLLFAECCNSIVVPNKKDNIVTYCPCGQSAVWWIVGAIGHLGVYGSSIDRVSVLGIMNSVLTAPCSSWVNKPQMEQILKDCPDNYLFKQINSAIIRFRPTYSNDTFFFSEKDKIPGQLNKPKLIGGDAGYIAEELLQDVSEIEEKRFVITKAIKDGTFTLEEALEAYGLTKEQFEDKS